MIVADKPLNLEKSQGITSSNFRIKASRKAFQILSAGLYSDKVKAIIRELSTNAADSHVAAGKKDHPFRIHLPNNMEPYFSVTDDGVGLSDKQVRGDLLPNGEYSGGVYTTYFDSDKTDSNELTGCLGLGSKSPFSYVDQFTVESRYDGVKRTYNAHMSEDGLPAVSLLGEVPTKECNGVTIAIAVKSDDFWEFQRKAAEVLRWFAVKPTVVGVPDFEVESREYMRQTEKYGLTKNRDYNSYVVMGNVAYQVRASDLRNSKADLTPIEVKVLEWGCDLFVPIGALDIAANREKVSYDDASVKALKVSLAAAVADIREEVETIITNAPSLWQARRALHDAQHSILGQIKDVMNVTWQGQAITSYVNTKKSSTPPECQCLTQRNTKFKKNFTDMIHADGDTIIINDLGHGGYARAIRYLNDNNKQKCYYLQGVQQPFLDESGIQEAAVFTSKLPKPERTPRVAVPRRPGAVKAKLNEYTETCHSNVCAEYWKPAEVDLNAGGIYVEISYFRFKKPGQDNCHPSDLRKVVELFRQLGYEEKIYGIRPGDIKALEKHEGWISLEAFVEAVLDENDEIVDTVQLIEQWNNLDDRGHTQCFFEHIQELEPTSVFGKFLTTAQKAEAALKNDKARAYARLCDVCGRSMPTNAAVDSLNEMREKVYKKYPLLQYLNWYNSSATAMRKGVIAYVKAIDK